MQEQSTHETGTPAPRPRRKLICGATSCGGCVKECGVVVYRYIAGLDEEEEREQPHDREDVSPSSEAASSFRIQNS